MKRRIYSIRAVLLLAATIFLHLSSASAQQKVNLKLRLAKGKTYYSEMTVDQTIKMTINGEPQILKQTMGFGYDMVVSKEDQNGQELTTTYQRIRIGVNGIGYDSENPAASTPALADLFKNLVGKSFTISIDKKGNIYAVKGIDEMVDAMLKNLPPNQEATAMLRGSINNQKFLDDFSRHFNIFPQGEVKPGDSWNKTMKSKFFGETTQVVDYTLQKLTPSTAGLLLANKINAEIDNLGVKTRLTGEGAGTMDVDRESGFPMSSTLILKMSGTVTQASGTVPMEISGTYTTIGKIK